MTITLYDFDNTKVWEGFAGISVFHPADIVVYEGKPYRYTGGSFEPGKREFQHASYERCTYIQIGTKQLGSDIS